MASTWLDDLNPAQREAVTHGDGPLLIVAGAGTGKTRTLACRVAHLIERGVPAERILLLTFTRRAAAEMLSRARQLTGAAAVQQVWGGTFHAVANRLLRVYGRALDLSPDFTVMDQSDAADLMNLIRGDLGFAKKERRFPRKQTLVNIYSRAVNAEEKLSEVLEKRYPWCVREKDALAEVFEQYTQRKAAQNLLDYDDLLLYWQTLCAAPGVGQRVAERFEHVLVDEYQDTNAMQAGILLGLRRDIKNICVVGDDAQSIYSFRAATVRNILDFPEQFPGTRIVTLEQNYRSTQPILRASNAVMAQARERYTKELFSERHSDAKPVLYTCVDEDEQTALVCDNILFHRERGVDLREQAVLFRASHHSAHLEIELARRNIPFHKYGGLKFLEAAHIKDMLAFLRILENPFDEISWFRILQMFEGVGPRVARRIMNELGTNNRRGEALNDEGESTTHSVSTPLKRFLANPPRVPAAAEKMMGELRTALAECIGLASDGATGAFDEADFADLTTAPVAGQVERVRAFYEPIFKERYGNADVRLRDLEQLERIAAGYRSRGRFIAELTLDPPNATSDWAQPPHRDEDYLILSTIHSAKGCEWTVVNIIHAADGMIPSDMATEDEEQIDEERRLFYVAMTRAKDTLYVYFPLRYYHHRFGHSDTHNYAQLTRFLPAAARACFEDRAPARSASSEPDAGLGDQPVNLKDLRERLNHLFRN